MDQKPLEERNLSSAEIQLREACALEQRGKLDESLICCQRALSFSPNNPEAQRLGTRLLAAMAVSDAARFSSPSNGHIRPPVPEHAPMISIVICSIDAEKFASVSANYGKLLAGWPHEIIGIHDARSMCDGYNRGSARARGDIVVFSHDDIEILSTDFASRLSTLIRDYDMIGIAGSSRFPDTGFWGYPGTPYVQGQVAHRAPGERTYTALVFGVGGPAAAGIQVLDGVFFAVRRRVLETVEFDSATFDGFHFYDIDFSYRVFSAGFDIAVSNEIAIVHQSRGSFGEEWQKYARRFLAKHAGRIPAAASTVPTYWTPSVSYLETPQQVVAYFASLVATAACVLDSLRAGVPPSSSSA